jgi:hypothetical protein
MVRGARKQVAWRAAVGQSSRTRQTAAKESFVRASGQRQPGKGRTSSRQPASRTPAIPLRAPPHQRLGAGQGHRKSGQLSPAGRPDHGALGRDEQYSTELATGLSALLLAQLADCQVQNVGSSRHHERPAQADRAPRYPRRRTSLAADQQTVRRRPASRESSAAGPRSKRGRSIQVLWFSGVSARPDTQRRNPARSACCTRSWIPLAAARRRKP